MAEDYLLSAIKKAFKKGQGVFLNMKCSECAKGCKQCLEGRKLVLFVTGLCGQKCWYCPVGEHKTGKDSAYANEWEISDADNPTEMIQEAKLTNAQGCGITGGDPLVKLERTIKYIRMLKKEFGKQFHIHLYTPLLLVTEDSLQKLYDAGLDEIRFHPSLEDKKLWEKLELALKHDWDVGIEIPAIPGYEKITKELIDYVAGKVKFLNLNELERSDTTVPHYKLDEKGYEVVDNTSHAIKGSKEMALQMAEYAKQKGLFAHFCTAAMKDGIQMKKRIQLRAENVSHEFDIITEDGMLIRGAAYVSSLEPGLEYEKRTKGKDSKSILQEALSKLSIPAKIDAKRHRLLMSPEDASQHKEEIKKLGLLPAIVEEYPTEDALEIDLEFL